MTAVAQKQINSYPVGKCDILFVENIINCFAVLIEEI